MRTQVKCPRCNQPVDTQARYCPHCQVDLARAAVLASQYVAALKPARVTGRHCRCLHPQREPTRQARLDSGQLSQFMHVRRIEEPATPTIRDCRHQQLHRIRHVAIEPTIAFGRLDGQPDPRLQRLREAFLRAGVKADIPADIQAACWMKFIFIAAFSGIGAVTRSPVGVFRSLPETRQMLLQAIEEIAAVGKAQGVALQSEADESSSGPAYFMLEDPDGNPILVDQHV